LSLYLCTTFVLFIKSYDFVKSIFYVGLTKGKEAKSEKVNFTISTAPLPFYIYKKTDEIRLGPTTKI
jgi:hypothetical protein